LVSGIWLQLLKTGQIDRSLASILSPLLVYISFVTRLSKKQKITEFISKHPTVKHNAIKKKTMLVNTPVFYFKKNPDYVPSGSKRAAYL